MNSDLFIVLLTLAAGAVVMLATYAGLSVVNARNNPLQRRLAALSKAPLAHKAAKSHRFGKALEPLAPYLLPKREKERETVRLQLIRAGYRSQSAVLVFYGIKVLCILVMPAAIVTWLLLSYDLHWAAVMLAGASSAFIGMLVPNLHIRNRTGARHREMLNALPDALDLLVSCTEAGLGLNAALQRVSKQMDISSPLLASELEQVNAEIRGGVDRIEALRDLAYRTGLDEIRGLVSLLSQSLRFGSSIAEILRIYAEEFRDRRMQRAEEQAALVGTKLIFPLCFCIFPAFFIVTVGPAVIGVIRAMAESNF